MNVEWTDAHPLRSALKLEVRVMVDAIASALRAELGDAAIRGIYFKGSAQRPWDTLLDYVPELSDIDIHLWLHGDGEVEATLFDIDRALRIQAAYERAYLESVFAPIHVPRPQIIVLNTLKQQTGYVPPPMNSVEILYGEPLPQDGAVPPEEIRRIDAEKLLECSIAIGALPMQVIDKPGRYCWISLRNLAWRVSPTGPRILDLLGVHPDQTWTLNRTSVDRELRARGQHGIADLVAGFYLGAWEYFLSGDQNTDAARRALLSGASAVTTAASAFAAKPSLKPETT